MLSQYHGIRLCCYQGPVILVIGLLTLKIFQHNFKIYQLLKVVIDFLTATK